MSISNSLYTATSALNSFGTSISVVGNNIANLNTVGFKPFRTEFADLLPSLVGGLEFGHGVRTDVNRYFSQGSLQTTGIVTDLAIQGAGLFLLRDVQGNTFYTRAGQFHLDRNGSLVNPSGLALQGASGNISLNLGMTLPARATSSLSLAVNLNAEAVTPAASFPGGPDAGIQAWMSASNFSAAVPVYDAQGDSHDLTFVYRKTGPNNWEYRILARTNEVDPLAAGSTDLRQVGSGTLVFTPNGGLDSSLSTVGDIGPLTWVNGGSQTISAASLNFPGTVQFAQPSSVLTVRNDGASSGRLTGFSIDEQGNVIGRFSNGQTSVLDRIVLANFANIDGLEGIGDTLLALSRDSGNARIGVPGQGGFGAIVSGALEMSTVDLAREFVSLIQSQRDFQMNSRVISVADRMYEQAANLK